MCLLCCGKARQANFARNIQCRRLEIILGIAHIAFTVTHSWSQGAVMEKNLHMINTDILASNGQKKKKGLLSRCSAGLLDIQTILDGTYRTKAPDHTRHTSSLRTPPAGIKPTTQFIRLLYLCELTHLDGKSTIRKQNKDLIKYQNTTNS